MGRFLFTPVMGHFSDRFGRRTILIIGIFGSSIFAFLRSIAPDYITFITFEFLEAAIGSANYSAVFILIMEWVGTKDRVLLSAIITALYPLGQIYLAVIARAVQNYRYLLRIIYAPGFLIISYIWLAPESILWLIVRGEKERVMAILKQATRVNGTSLSASTEKLLNQKFIEQKSKTTNSNDTSSEAKSTNRSNLRDIFQKKVFLTRFIVCAFLWISNAFLGYGISIMSVKLEGDKYNNFIIVSFAGIVAMFFYYIMLEKCGRRWTLCSSMLITGLSLVISSVLPYSLSQLAVAFFFVGKCFVTVSFSSLYVYTSELWPTDLRHSIVGTCSTMGRIGAMFAPLAPLLVSLI